MIENNGYLLIFIKHKKLINCQKNKKSLVLSLKLFFFFFEIVEY